MQYGLPSSSPNGELIYLDYNATTPLAPQVRDQIVQILNSSSNFGNPSSIHWAGRGPKASLRESRAAFAQMVGCLPSELIFTSGGTEGNHTVISDAITRMRGGGTKNLILATSVEHSSVMKPLQAYCASGGRVQIIPVDRAGNLDMEFFKNALSENVALVSVMLANNETGVINPIREMVALAHGCGALFHCDMVQGLGKVDIDLQELQVDFATFSGHKFYGLKGTGVLYVRRGSTYGALLMGSQERSRRGGTENTLGILSLGTMALQKNSASQENSRVRELRDQMEEKILREISGVTIIGRRQPRLPNTSSMMINGIDGESLLMSLDLKGFAVSTGAACSSGNPEPSPVLLAMGYSLEEAQKSLRVSLGWLTTNIEVEKFVSTLTEVVSRLRRFHRGPDATA